jgi:hypothetical protein
MTPPGLVLLVRLGSIHGLIVDDVRSVWADQSAVYRLPVVQ